MQLIANQLPSQSRSLLIVFPLLLAQLLMYPSSLNAQDVEAAQQLMDLTEKMRGADDPCPYLPQVRMLMNRIANSDPDVYKAMASELDEINQMDLSCSNTSNHPQPAPQNPGSSQAPAGEDSQPPVNVRYSAGETRMLTDPEFNKLRSGLHYRPEATNVVPGGSARTILEDGSGTPLVSITVTWISTDRTGATLTGRFRVTMTNSSNCLFSSHASMLIPGSVIDAYGVSFATWESWVALHDPRPGQTSSVNGIATLGNNYSALTFKPDQPEYSLSQCRTSSSASDSTSASQASGTFLAPKWNSCVHSFYDKDFYGWLAYQNTCGSGLSVLIVGFKPPFYSSTLEIPPGKSANTGFSPKEESDNGGFELYICPLNYVPVDVHGRFISRPSTEFACKQIM